MRESEIVAFLDCEFHLASGDLIRGRSRLRIPQQTSRLLAILVERAGTVVTRDELQRFLWPDGEFLDHEQAINRVVTDLRSALRDDPRRPKFIETVHKRGYRFLPDVSFTGRTLSSGPSEAQAIDHSNEASFSEGAAQERSVSLVLSSPVEQGEIVVEGRWGESCALSSRTSAAWRLASACRCS